MKRVLLIVLCLPACQGPSRFTVTSGSTTMSVEQAGHVGGQNYAHVTRSAKGALAITSRSNMERSFTDATQAATLVAGGLIQASVQKAKDASDAGVAIGAQKAATKEAAISAGVATEAIHAETIKATTIPH